VGRREQNKLEKRRRLEAEGLKAFLELGYDRASIEQIAAAADVARGTYYLYFSDKLALFEVLVDRWFQPVLEVMQETHDALSACTDRSQVLGIYEEMGMGLALVGITNPECVLLAFRESRHAGEAGERIRRRELQLQEAVVNLTELAAGRDLITAEDPKLTGFVILGAVEKLYYEFLAGTDLGDPQKMARNVVRLFGKVLELPPPVEPAV
jgi:AcrR family transcriptional regulator